MADQRYSGVLLVLENGRLLLQRRDDKPHIVNPGRVTLFGGLAEVGETPRDCAIRELREELELVVQEYQLNSLGSIVKAENDGISTECSLFALDMPRDTAIVQHEGVGLYVAEAADAIINNEVSEVALVAIRQLCHQRGKLL